MNTGGEVTEVKAGPRTTSQGTNRGARKQAFSLSVRGRFVLGFGTMFVILAIAIATALFEVGTTATRIDRMAHLRVPTGSASADLTAQIYASLASLRGWTITGDPAFKAERAAVWSEISRLREELDTLSADWTDPENVERWREVKPLLDEFSEAQSRIEAVANSPEEQPATKLLVTEAAPRAAVIVGEITRIIDEEVGLEATAERKALLGMMADVRGSMGMGLANIRAYLLTGAQESQDNFAKMWTTNEKRFTDLEANRHLLTPTQKEAFDTLAAARSEFTPLPPKMFEIRASKKWNMANYLLVTEAMPRADRILDRLVGTLGDNGRRVGGMRDSQIELLETDAADSADDIGLLRVTLWVLLVVGLAAAGVIGWFTTRSILRPLVQAVDVSRRIAAGEREVEIEVSSADETGLLLDSLNDMQQSIRQAEMEARETEARTRQAVLDTMVDGVITIEEQGIVQSFNGAAERLFGYKASEVIGQNVKMLMPEPYYSAHDAYIGNYLRTGEAKIIGIGREVEGKRKDGTSFPMELGVNETRVNENRIFTGVLRDISERKEAERKLQESNARTREILESTMTTVTDYSELIGGVASGDLTQRLSIDGDGDLAKLGERLNSMTDSLGTIAKRIGEVTTSMGTTLDEVEAAVTAQSSVASQQASSVNETTSTLQEIKATSEQTLERAAELGHSAERTREEADKGVEAVQETIGAMQAVRDKVEGIAKTILALSEHSQQIGEITDSVSNLAQQSKMLALNASIEAAKAGEAGKGFAVVATEVGLLAEQSREATDQVQKSLQEIQQATDKAVMATEEGTKEVDQGTLLVEQTGEVVRNLKEVIEETVTATQQIVAAVRQEAAGIEQISTAMGEINTATSQSVAATQQTKEATKNMLQIIAELGDSVSVYKL